PGLVVLGLGDALGLNVLADALDVEDEGAHVVVVRLVADADQAEALLDAAVEALGIGAENDAPFDFVQHWILREGEVSCNWVHVTAKSLTGSSLCSTRCTPGAAGCRSHVQTPTRPAGAPGCGAAALSPCASSSRWRPGRHARWLASYPPGI